MSFRKRPDGCSSVQIPIACDQRVGATQPQHDFGNGSESRQRPAEKDHHAPSTQAHAERCREVCRERVERYADHAGTIELGQSLLDLTAYRLRQRAVSVLRKQHLAEQLQERQVAHVPSVKR